MRELLIKIRAILEGAGLKDAAAGQRELSAATKEATRAAEQQKPVVDKQVEQQNKSADASKKHATGLVEVKRASGPATEAMSSLATAVQGGSAGFMGLIRAAKAAVSAIALGLGPAGIAAVAIGALAGLVAGLAKKFSDPQSAADRLAERIENAKKRVEDLNAQQLGGLTKEFTAAGDAIDAEVKRAQLLLDLEKQLLAARTGSAIATVEASAMSDAQKAEQIAALKLNQQLAEADTPVKRAAIEADAYAKKLEAARVELEKIDVLFQSQFGKLTDLETDRATAREQIAQIRKQAATGSPSSPGQPMSPREFEDSGLAARERQLRAAIGDEGKAAIEAQRKAFEETEKALDAANARVGDLETAAKEAADALALIKNITGTPGTPGTIKGEIAGTAGAGIIGRANTAAPADDQPPGVAGPGGAKPDFSLAGIRRGRIPAADGGTILVGGKPYVPADVPETPLRDAPATPLRDSPAGTIEVRDAQGNLVDAVKQGAKQGVAEGLSEIPRRARGGDVKKGEPQVVGDGGQSELFVPPEDGTILPEVDDGIISDSREAGSGDRAPQQASRPKGISSSAEAAADNAIESAIWAAQHGSKEKGYGADGSDRANAAAVRSFREREPERWAQMMSDGLARLEQANQANHAAAMEQSRLMTHYLQEIYFQGKKLGIA
jgi:hypothetical protein